MPIKKPRPRPGLKFTRGALVERVWRFLFRGYRNSGRGVAALCGTAAGFQRLGSRDIRAFREKARRRHVVRHRAHAVGRQVGDIVDLCRCARERDAATVGGDDVGGIVIHAVDRNAVNAVTGDALVEIVFAVEAVASPGNGVYRSCPSRSKPPRWTVRGVAVAPVV